MFHRQQKPSVPESQEGAGDGINTATLDRINQYEMNGELDPANLILHRVTPEPYPGEPYRYQPRTG